MKNKILKYLNSKDTSTYNNLDNTLELFVEGKLKANLEEYGFYNINLYPYIKKVVILLKYIFAILILVPQSLYMKIDTNMCYIH